MFALLITAILTLLTPTTVQAGSKLIVSSESNYSLAATNFSAGQNVYVKLETDAPADGIHQLNLRDNSYNLLQSFNLVKNQNNFTAVLAAPSAQGYYSLEAVIESSGRSVKSVKTIKVGSPQNADIKVNVKSNQNGNSSTNQDSDTESQSAENEESEIEASPEPSNASSAPPQAEVQNESLAGAVFSIVKAVFNFLWPF